MGKVRTDELLEARNTIEALKAEKKAAAAQLFKLKQKVEAYFKEVEQLRKQLGAPRDENVIIRQLKDENRQLRASILTAVSESTVQARLAETLKKERDAALVQLKKSPTEQAAAAPPAP